ncbi:MAG: 4Fe-4S binding protein [Negativicutes bacterium]|nr:4Fe-4S binding protein [Negativicutes bacterium]
MAVEINRRYCKGCGICVELCPKSVLVLDEIGKSTVKNPDACIYCGQCELRCPDYAITVVKPVKKEEKA